MLHENLPDKSTFCYLQDFLGKGREHMIDLKVWCILFVTSLKIYSQIFLVESLEQK